MMRRFLHAGSMVCLLATGMVVTQAARTRQGSSVDLLINRARSGYTIRHHRAATTRIHGVVTRGRYLDRAKRHSMLVGVARDVSRMKGQHSAS